MAIWFILDILHQLFPNLHFANSICEIDGPVRCKKKKVIIIFIFAIYKYTVHFFFEKRGVERGRWTSWVTINLFALIHSLFLIKLLHNIQFSSPVTNYSKKINSFNLFSNKILRNTFCSTKVWSRDMVA